MIDIATIKTSIATHWKMFEMPPSKEERTITALFVNQGLNNRFIAVAYAIPAIAVSAIMIVGNPLNGVLKGVVFITAGECSAGFKEIRMGALNATRSIYNIIMIFGTAVDGLLIPGRIYGAMQYVVKDIAVEDGSKSPKEDQAADPKQSQEYKKLAQQLETIEQELVVLRNTFLANEAEKAQLNTETSNLKRQLERFEEDAKATQLTINLHEAKNEELKKFVNTLKTQLDQAALDKQASIEEKEQIASGLQAAVLALTAQIKELEALAVTTSSEKTLIMRELEQKNAELQTANQQVCALQEEVTNAKQTMASAEAANKTLGEVSRILGTNIEALKKLKPEEFKTQAALELLQSLMSANGKAERLEAQNKTLQLQVDKLEEKKRNLKVLTRITADKGATPVKKAPSPLEKDE